MSEEKNNSDGDNVLKLNCTHNKIVETLEEMLEMAKKDEIDGIFVCAAHKTRCDVLSAMVVDGGCAIYSLLGVIEHAKQSLHNIIAWRAIVNAQGGKQGQDQTEKLQDQGVSNISRFPQAGPDPTPEAS